MQVIINMVGRNMKKYLRDRAAVFFSFLSVFIVLFLYIFFLGDMQVSNIRNSLSNMPDIDDRIKDIEFMINSWLIAGLLAVNTITIPLSILTMKVEDSAAKIDYDFNATPAKRYQIVLGYIISAWIIGIITSILVLVVGEIYIVMKGGALLGLLDIIKVLAVVSFSTIMFSGMFYILVMFLKTLSQVNTVNTIVGTFSGFLGGIYVPLGFLGSIGIIVKLFPLAHTAALLRQIFMKDAMDKVFAGAPAETVSNMRDFLGIDIIIGSHTLNSVELLLIMGGFTVICYVVSMILYSKMKRN